MNGISVLSTVRLFRASPGTDHTSFASVLYAVLRLSLMHVNAIDPATERPRMLMDAATTHKRLSSVPRSRPQERMDPKSVPSNSTPHPLPIQEAERARDRTGRQIPGHDTPLEPNSAGLALPAQPRLLRSLTTVVALLCKDQWPERLLTEDLNSAQTLQAQARLLMRPQRPRIRPLQRRAGISGYIHSDRQTNRSAVFPSHSRLRNERVAE